MTKRRPEKFCLRVVKGGFQPADTLTEARLRNRKYSIGELIFAELKKPRNPGFHRLAHAIGAMAADNIEDFDGMDAHTVLKRLQMESGAGCEEVAYKVGTQMVVQRIPLSLSYESMDQVEFKTVIAAICHRLTHYWPDTSEDEIKRMAEEYTMQGNI